MTRTYDWGKVDWGQQDVFIASLMGCSREAVRQARVRLGVGAARTPRARTVTVEGELKGLETEELTLSEVAGKIGYSEKHIGVVLGRMGKCFKRRKGRAWHNWGLFPANWEEMTDKEIGLVVGVDEPCVVTQWRNRHGYRKNGVPHGHRKARGV
jgi:hypothetical protein